MIHGVLSSLSLIGNTPLIKIGRVYAKLESANPGGSIKDRAAIGMVEAAEKEGTLRKGYTIVEPTSGNTGVSLSMIAAIKGYRMIVVMPKGMSREKMDMIRAFGARLIITPSSKGMAGAVLKAKELAKKQGRFMPSQFENKNNPGAQEEIGREILMEIGPVDAFVAGVGTGGTLIGVARALKKANPATKIIAVEPKESPILSGGKAGKHGIEGISDGFIPKLFDRKKVDGVVSVSTKDAIRMSRRLARKHGLLVGISSGANMVAAGRMAKRYKRVATVLPDTGLRYLSKGLYK